MRSVVIALKERGEAAGLAAVSAALAESEGRVEVVHVVEHRSHRALATAEHAVAHALDLLRARGITARGHVDVTGEGGVAERLVERARTSGAELVVVGSRGLGHVGGLVGGSVSHALLADLDVPVLVLPRAARAPEHGLRRVLVAVGGEGDAGAEVAAVRLLSGGTGEVLVVHVPRRLAIHAGGSPAATFVEIGETSTAVLATARRRFKAAGIRIETRTVDRDGGVAAAICDTAREWAADLIVLGSRRPGAWEALVAGSTTLGVLRRSDRPVLIAGRTWELAAGRRRDQGSAPGVPVWRAR
jgi:nucleotide-binding universal stress UspA family protein